MNVSAGVITGAHHIVDGCFDDAGFGSAGTFEVAAFEVAVAAADHLIVAIGGLVIERCAIAEMLRHGCGCCAIEGAAHAGAMKIVRVSGVARLAQFGVDVGECNLRFGLVMGAG